MQATRLNEALDNFDEKVSFNYFELSYYSNSEMYSNVFLFFSKVSKTYA